MHVLDARKKLDYLEKTLHLDGENIRPAWTSMLWGNSTNHCNNKSGTYLIFFNAETHFLFLSWPSVNPNGFWAPLLILRDWAKDKGHSDCDKTQPELYFLNPLLTGLHRTLCYIIDCQLSIKGSIHGDAFKLCICLGWWSEVWQLLNIWFQMTWSAVEINIYLFIPEVTALTKMQLDLYIGSLIKIESPVTVNLHCVTH